MLLMTNWWLLFPVNVFRPKFAAADLPTNLRNVQLASFFRLYFCCLLDQDLKGQCRWKNWAILRWFLAHVILLACVNKDFVYSGSIGLIEVKHARYVIKPLCNSHLFPSNATKTLAAFDQQCIPNRWSIQNFQMPSRTMKKLSCHSQSWENVGTEVIHWDQWLFCNLILLQKSCITKAKAKMIQEDN